MPQAIESTDCAAAALPHFTPSIAALRALPRIATRDPVGNRVDGWQYHHQTAPQPHFIAASLHATAIIDAHSIIPVVRQRSKQRQALPPTLSALLPALPPPAPGITITAFAVGQHHLIAC